MPINVYFCSKPAIIVLMLAHNTSTTRNDKHVKKAFKHAPHIYRKLDCRKNSSLSTQPYSASLSRPKARDVLTHEAHHDLTLCCHSCSLVGGREIRPGPQHRFLCRVVHCGCSLIAFEPNCDPAIRTGDYPHVAKRKARNYWDQLQGSATLGSRCFERASCCPALGKEGGSL